MSALHGRTFDVRDTLPWPHIGEPLEALEARERRLTRRDYHEARRTAHRLACEAAMLRRAMPQTAANDAARAEALRAAIAVPVDQAEAVRMSVWRGLRIALAHGIAATHSRNKARAIARMVRK